MHVSTLKRVTSKAIEANKGDNLPAPVMAHIIESYATVGSTLGRFVEGLTTGGTNDHAQASFRNFLAENNYVNILNAVNGYHQEVKYNPALWPMPR